MAPASSICLHNLVQSVLCRRRLALVVLALIAMVVVYQLNLRTAANLPTPVNDTLARTGKYKASSPETNDVTVLSVNDTLARIRSYKASLPQTNDVTVVTAYFNLGNLDKVADRDGKRVPYTTSLYKEWMAVFGRMDNDLVVFVDEQDTAEIFCDLRLHFPASRTKLFVLSRKDLWAFNLSEEIAAIYGRPGYPRHPPNTLNPLYSCAMHAKFELMQRVVERELYSTQYLAWIDIGLFRQEVNNKEPLKLLVPGDFDRTKVAYSKVFDFAAMTPWQVIEGNNVWIGGASFLATPEVMYLFCLQYRQAVRKLLDQKMMSTDQQVIYSIFQPSFNFSRLVDIQILADGWFGVGYKLKDEGQKTNTTQKAVAVAALP